MIKKQKNVWCCSTIYMLKIKDFITILPENTDEKYIRAVYAY